MAIFHSYVSLPEGNLSFFSVSWNPKRIAMTWIKIQSDAGYLSQSTGFFSLAERLLHKLSDSVPNYFDFFLGVDHISLWIQVPS